jgi:hypothetical protein
MEWYNMTEDQKSTMNNDTSFPLTEKWRFEKVESNRPEFARDPYSFEIIDHDGWVIAKAAEERYAILMSKAPELYRACNELLDIIVPRELPTQKALNILGLIVDLARDLA